MSVEIYVGKQLYSTRHFHNDDIGHYLCVSSGTVSEIAVMNGELVLTIKWDDGAESTRAIAQGINGFPDNLYEDKESATRKIIDGERSRTIIGARQK